MYAIVITIPFGSIVQSLFILWLWWRMHKDAPLMIEYAEAMPSAPAVKM